MKSETLHGAYVVIPAYNESKHIADVIRKSRKFCRNILVVDDGSTDNTSALAKAAGADVLRHILNLGKGAALKTGCDYSLTKGIDKIIVLDADGQHDPEHIPSFVKALDRVDIVFGVRTFNKRMPLIFRLGNSFISKSAAFLFRIKIKDTQCGYRAFTAQAYRKIRWSSTDYSMESEMIANAGKNNLRYKEIPIRTIYRDRYKGTTIVDGIKIFFNMLWWKISK